MSEPLFLQTVAPAAAPTQTTASPASSESSDSGGSAAEAGQFDALLQSKRNAMAGTPAKAPSSESRSPDDPRSARAKTSDDAEADVPAVQDPLEQIAYSAGDGSVPIIALPLAIDTLQPAVVAPKAQLNESREAIKAAADAPVEAVAVAAQPLSAPIQAAAKPQLAAAQPQLATTRTGELEVAAARTALTSSAQGETTAQPLQPTRPADDSEAPKKSFAAVRMAATASPVENNPLPPTPRVTPDAAPVAPAVSVSQVEQMTGVRPAISEQRRVTADAVADASARRDEISYGALPNSEARAAEQIRHASVLSEAATAGRVDAAGPTNATPVPVATDRAAPSASVHVEPRVGDRGWGHEFASQVTLLVSNREPQAEIRINPQHLGPVEVRIAMDGDKVTLMFAAVHPDTRAAIQDALPQLHEMLADSGLSLGNASVSAESSNRDPSQPAFGAAARSVDVDTDVVDPAILARVVSNRLVDTFA